VRWVTPAQLNSHPRSLFFITAPHSAKVAQCSRNAAVQWLFQTPALDRIITITAQATVIDNPSLVSEVLEQVAPRLRTFWKINQDKHAMVVVESIIETATLMLPLTGEKKVYEAAKEAGHGSKA
jgi:general stress protein 26